MAISYTEALAIAQELEAQLAPGCERILIAGSVRREKPIVKDVELVATSRFEPSFDMFGNEHIPLDLLERQLIALSPVYIKNGSRYRQFLYKGVTVDLFIVPLSEWGVQTTIRTGCSAFSQWLVTPRRQGGALPAGWKVANGRIWDGDERLVTPEEQDVFDALELDWVEPAERTPEYTATLWRR